MEKPPSNEDFKDKKPITSSEVANNTQESLSSEQIIKNYSEAVSTRMRLRYGILPAIHPASKELSNILSQITDDPEVSVSIISSSREGDVPAAMAIPNKEIYISTELLKTLRSKEEVAALLMHELGHIERGHLDELVTGRTANNALGSIARTRTQELEADLGMLTQLDERGINPLGALKLFEGLKREDQQNRGKSGRASIDPTHGSGLTRESTLRETIRFIDLPHLSQQLEAVDFERLLSSDANIENYDESKLASLSLEPEEFWKQVKRGDGRLILEYVKARIPDGSEESQQALLGFILQRPDWDLKSGTSEIISKNYLDSIGLKLTPQSLLSLVKAAITETCTQANEEKLADDIKILRESAILEHERLYQKDTGFISLIDSNILNSFVVNNLRVSSVLPTISEVTFEKGSVHNFRSMTQSDGATASRLSIGQEVNELRNIFDTEQLSQFISDSGCILPAIGELVAEICKKAGIYEGVLNNSNAYNGLFVSPEDARKLLQFFDVLSSELIPILDNLINKVEQNADPGMDYIFQLVLLAKGIPDLIVGNAEAFSKAEGERTLLNGLDGNQYADTYTFALETTFIAKLSGYLESIAEKTNESERLLSDIHMWKELGSDQASNHQLVRSLLSFLEFITRSSLTRGISVEDRAEEADDYEGADLDDEDEIRTNFYSYLNRDEVRSSVSVENAKFFSLFDIFTKDKLSVLRGADELLGSVSKGYSDAGTGELLDFIDRALKIKNELEIGGEWKMGKKERSQLRSVSRQHKTKALKALTLLEGNDILQKAPGLIEEWPVLWTGIPKQAYDKNWEAISKEVSQEIDGEDIEDSPERLEQILSLLFLSQSSWSSISLTSAIFNQIINKSDSFDVAFNYLKKYDHVPLSLLQPGLESLVEEKANTKEQLEQLQKWMQGQLEEAAGTGDALLSAEASQILSPYIDRDNRNEVLFDILTTNQSDEKFKKYFAKKWWATIPNEFTVEDITNITQLAYTGERMNDSRLARAGVEVSNPPRDLVKSGYIAFEELYQSSFQLNGVTKYLILRNLTLDEPNGIFRDTEAKQNLLNKLLQHYTEGTDGAEIPQTMRDVSASVSEAISPEDLFYYTGPFLAGIALQTPANSYPTTGISRELFGPILKDLSARYSEVQDREKSFNTQALIAARLKTLLSGQVPKVKYLGAGQDLQIEWPKETEYRRIEEELVMEKLSHLLPKTPEIGDQLTPLDLAIRLGEQAGSLGVRWLQMVGLYFDFSADEREKINHVFDRVRGQNKLTAFQVIEREAKKHPEMDKLAKSVESYNGMLGGGSIVTVYDVQDNEGKEWAVGVKNPNAEYRSQELKQLLASVLESLKGKMPDSGFVELSQSLLDDAHQWIEAEINDERYIEKTQAFFEKNDYRSTDEDSFKAADGIKWKVKVPEIKNTDTNWVRWEELIRGKNLSQFKVAEGDINKENTLSKEDAKSAAALISQNFLFQLFEQGLAHSDIHPGNFILTPESEIAILDRKNLLEFNREEREFLLDIITTGALQGSVKDVVTKFVQFFIEGSMSADIEGISRAIIDSIQSEENLAPENLISKILILFKQEGQAVPLKWTLLVKDFLGLNRIAQWAGFEHFLEALLFSPDGQNTNEILKQVLPSISKDFNL